MQAEADQMITVGQITTTHGVQGELRVLPLTDFPERFSLLTAITVEQNGKRWVQKIEAARTHKQFVILKLEGMDRPETAAALRGAKLLIPKEQVMPLPEGDFYIYQLIGLKVFTEAGKHIGKVADIFRTGSNDVYAVKDDAGKEYLIPALKTVVRKIDLQEGTITVQPLPGLLED